MPCPVCALQNATLTATTARGNDVHCHRCGVFRVTTTFTATRPNDLTLEQIGNASGWVRDHQGVYLQAADWDTLKSLESPGIGEKAEKLLLYLAKRFPKAGQTLTFQGDEKEQGSCWAADHEEVNYLFHTYLWHFKEFLAAPGNSSAPKISPAGWEYLHSLRQVNKESQIGFCAMWFNPGIEFLWKEGIEPAIRLGGYNAVRIDKHQHNNRIDDEMIAMIRQSKFMVADCTEQRQNVYFEAGFALGLGLTVIWTVRDDHLAGMHFDNRQYSFITWKQAEMLTFSDALRFHIEATIGRGSGRPSVT
jgi:hypothetical protein